MEVEGRGRGGGQLIRCMKDVKLSTYSLEYLFYFAIRRFLFLLKSHMHRFKMFVISQGWIIFTGFEGNFVAEKVFYLSFWLLTEWS